MIETKFVQRIAEETELSPSQVTTAIELVSSGATIPFIARYRRDITGGLSEEQLEVVADRNIYYTALTDRRDYVMSAIAKHGEMTDEIRARIESCYDKSALEDIYLPYRKRKRTKATVAREKGLTPLADYLYAQEPGEQTIEAVAAAYARPEKALATPEEALEGAVHIVAERLSFDPAIRAFIRDRMLAEGLVTAHLTKLGEEKKSKYSNYGGFSEPIRSIPSHRLLAILRGVREAYLRMELKVDDEQTVQDIRERVIRDASGPFAPFLVRAIDDAYHHLLRPALENDVINLERARADEEAIRVFRENARNILLAAPAGPIPIMGIQPDPEHGLLVAVVAPDGSLVENAAVALAQSTDEAAAAQAAEQLSALIAKHGIRAVAIGNGPGGREASALIRKVLTPPTTDDASSETPAPFCVLVNEAGAACYAGSKTGREELPDLDISQRKAVSVARRLQDPLAELVKIDPRYIGVGQYQHDVNQKKLREGLHRVVVSCVNAVGVDVSTASEHMLRYVSGIQPQTAANIVAFRTEHGGFTSLMQLLEVDGVGPRVFEQCSGFLRLPGSQNPLEATSIHPEAYPAVEAIAASIGVPVGGLIGKPELLAEVDLSPFASGPVGPLTLADIRDELAGRRRGPRTQFRVPKFIENITSVKDLEEGMVSEGVVTNVTDFGVFVDIGVNQDGLVHLSELANRFVRDPRTVAKVGDVVRVKVIKVDYEIPRISLSIKALQSASDARRRRPARRDGQAEAPAAAPDEARPDDTRREGDRREGDRREGDRRQGDRREGDRDEGDRREGDRRRSDGRPDRRRSDSGDRDQRSQRPRRERGGSSNRNRKGSSGGGQQSQRPAHGNQNNEPLNTQLADQLAALRDRLGS